MRKTLSLLAAATAVAVSFSATPASAAEYCFGAPSEPLSYWCVTVRESTLPPGSVSIEWGGQELIYELEPLLRRISELLPE